jgi:hypothetical protein
MRVISACAACVVGAVVALASPVAAQSASGPVVCDGSISARTTIRSDVIVPPGKSCSIDGTVIGNVYGQGNIRGESGLLPGAFVVIFGKVDGDVYSQGDPSLVGVVPGAVVVIYGTVTGNGYGQPGAFELVVSGGGLLRGDLFGSRMNYLIVQSGTVRGSVRADNMTLFPFGEASVQLNDGNVGDDVTISTTDLVVFFGSQVKGDATITGSRTVLVGDNVVSGDLTCLDNASVSLLGSPSVVHGEAKGQCANL